MDEKAYQERNASQKPAIELLHAMGYIYISPGGLPKAAWQPVSRSSKGHPPGAASQAEPLFLRRYGK